MKKPRDFASLIEIITPLAKHIAKIQRQMHALGIFANDRELLNLPHCGLREDVIPG